jgi:hypothetical protein
MTWQYAHDGSTPVWADYDISVQALDCVIDWDDPEWGFYWELRLKGGHVNGGVAKDRIDGRQRAQNYLFNVLRS